MTKLQKQRLLLAISAAVLLIVSLLTFTGLGAWARDTGSDGGDSSYLHYYNEDVQNYKDGHHEFSFGDGEQMLKDANQAVKDGKVKSVLDYLFHVNKDGVVTGVLYESLQKDPALLGALVTDYVKRSNDWSILGDRADEFKQARTAELPNKLHLAFLKDRGFWLETASNYVNALKGAKVNIEDLDSYKSSMYMWNDMLEGDKPAVIVRKTKNAGGQAIVFNFSEFKIRLRLQCRFQPIDIEGYWKVPDITIDDEETTKPHPEETTKPEKETTTLEKKHYPNWTDPTNPDYGGEKDPHDDTSKTPEPTSPSEYKPPAKPTTTQKETTTDGSKGSKSGSKTVDEDDGKQTTAKNGQDATVHAGDGKKRDDLGEVQSTHSHDTVEEPLKKDGTNKGDVDAPE